MTAKPTKCALWLRVSDASQSTENQLTPLKAFAARNGWQVGPVYRLDGASAYGDAETTRAAIERALRDGRAGKFSILVVWALDRLSRQGVESTFRTIRKFREANVQVVSVMEPWCGTGEAGELMMAIASWMAEQESARRSERVKAGIARRKADGLPVGRQPGARDLKPRKRSGYVKRWEREREAIS
jgi:DNA invertase Pin-like site-specific DNA recombinase